MNNLETLLNAETLHEMDSKSALSVIKLQFERFINSDLLKPLDIYSRSFSSDREVKEIFRDYTTMTAQTFKETIIQNMNSIEQCIIERASHEQELKMTLKKLSERQLQIQQCKVQEVQSSVTSSGDETSSGIVSVKRLINRNWKAHLQLHGQRFHRGVSHLKDPVLLVMPMEIVLNQKHDELVKKSLLNNVTMEGYLKRTQRPTFANPRYLKKAQSEKPCLYEIPYDTSDPANRFAPEMEGPAL
ncbi:hypothetical protein Tco_0425497 [Tanacetum coccineum]